MGRSTPRMDEPTLDPTAEWVAAARRGDQEASRQLIRCLYPTVTAIIRNHLPWSEREEDLAQEVFLKVFSRLDQFRGERPIQHWVSRIALFTCYDALRRQRTRRVLHFSDLSEAEARFLEDGLADESESRQSVAAGDSPRELLDKLLSTLKPDQQMVLRLLDLEQKSVREICALTGWRESKVKVTAMRARRKLSETLARMEEPIS